MNTPSRTSVGALASLVLIACNAGAAEVPQPTPADTRVRVVKYSATDVITIRVQRGTATRIVLASDEQIEDAVPGFSSQCESATDEWCISARKGSNQIFVRPRDEATHNNLELRTNKRDYSLDFQVLSDNLRAGGKGRGKSENEPFYRVVFDYPKPPATPASSKAAMAASLLAGLEQAQHQRALRGDGGMGPVERLKLEAPQVHNSNYTMQVLDRGEDSAPSLVFDDGRFTYFEFLGAREIPSIEAYNSDGEPMRVNWHVEAPFVVVERLARRFTLRLGSAVTGIFNESYDGVGIATGTATVSPAVKRELKEPK